MGAVGYILLIAAVSLVSGIVICNPERLGDNNQLLRELVDNQLLNILGVIIAIFLPSAANLHIRLAELEVKLNKSLQKYRNVISFNCGVLIVLFILMVILLVIKDGSSSISSLPSAVNGFALVVLLTNVLALADLTKAMFDVGEASVQKSKSAKTSNSSPSS